MIKLSITKESDHFTILVEDVEGRPIFNAEAPPELAERILSQAAALLAVRAGIPSGRGCGYGEGLVPPPPAPDYIEAITGAMAHRPGGAPAPEPDAG